MDLFLLVFNFACWVWTALSVGGYVFYKSTNKESWEDGVKSVATFGFEWIYEEFSGKEVDRKVVNSSLILSNQEVLELVERLRRQPYDTPTLIMYDPCRNGIAWFDVAAMNLVSQYRELENKQIAQLAAHVIQNFYMRSRERQVELFIKVASPTRLYFAVALSQDGADFLRKQGGISSITETGGSKAVAPLEETVEPPKETIDS